jgi:hypothetical protein
MCAFSILVIQSHDLIYLSLYCKFLLILYENCPELSIDEIKINAAGSVVKSLVVWPNRHYIFTAVQGNVLVWDLVDLTHKG